MEVIVTKKIGFEREFFLVDEHGKIVINPQDFGFPTDEFQLLVEARGKPSDNIDEAILSLGITETQLARKAEKLNMQLKRIPSIILNKKQVSMIYQRYGKTPNPNIRNLYGKQKNFSLRKINAGLHVHFSNTETITVTETVNNYFIASETKKFTETTTKEIVVNHMLDIPTIVRHLDNKFKDIIRRTGRTLGEYELKPHGFEYRSLPNDANLFDVAEESMKILMES